MLTQVSHELAQLAGRLGHFEQMVGPPILEAARRDPRFLRQIQDLDHLRQKIHALADFLAGLARFAPEQYRIDAGAAARGLTLAELAARLTLSKDGGGAVDAERGDLDLF
ncbi:hypothetical protein CR492_18890 [Methylocella silvestris]|uniref:Uncharacterized protein n=1 Tax=Methylocella silvestris TaxID=199596 RepID=A0A2J7TCC7_METSI|nr:hypothetical protein CR492_18890 [Methylocella silvestris]